MNQQWVEPDIRDAVVFYVIDKSSKSTVSLTRLLKQVGIHRSKFYQWKKRMGIDNHHNGTIPKLHWLVPWEREAIIAYAQECRSAGPPYMVYTKDGYRRLAYCMMDEDIVAVSPSSVYRVLKGAGLLNQWNTKKSSGKGTGYRQPSKLHEEWHTDIKYVNFKGTYLFLIGVMDGYSRYLVHHELRTHMTEYDVELTVQRAVEKFPDETPRIISDNGGQYISRDFQTFLKEAGLNHSRTSIAYPQSNGKIERFYRSINTECLKRQSLLDLNDARQQINAYVNYYNTQRLHSALYYLTPDDFLQGRVKAKLRTRQRKLKHAVEQRKQYWAHEKQIAS